jgi:VWFA-related protein
MNKSFIRINKRLLPRLVCIFLALILLAAGVALRAQQGPITPASPQAQAGQPQLKQPPQTAAPTQPTAKVSTETNLVTVYATVRDKHDKLVPTLDKNNFKLSEDNKPQTISYFARETDVPLTLGLLVDTSMSMAKTLDNERDASFSFLDQLMREDKDHAFVIHFDSEVELLQDVTSSKPKLQAALKLLSISQSTGNDDNQGGDRGGGQGQGRGYQGAGTHLYDAVYLASHDVIATQKGRKAIFVLSDGKDRGSKETLEEAIEAAQRANTAIYSLYFESSEPSFNRGFGHGGGMGRGGGGYPGGGGRHGGGGYPQEQRVDGKKVMQKMASETGGQFFEVTKKLPIDQVYASVEEELRNQYSLGYTPSPADTDGGYHRIELTVDQKDDTVQARDGYYSD